jgi:lipoprotein LprG
MKFLVLIWLAFLLAACGGDEAAPSGTTAEDVLSKSAAAVQNVTSFHFRLTHENGTTPMPLNLQLTTAEGDVVTPDRLAAKVNAKAAGSVSVNVDIIAVGDKTWVTNPFTRRWQSLPGATIKDVADPAALMASILRSIQDPVVTGQTELDGVHSYHVTGTMDSGALETSLPIAYAGFPVNIDLWIGSEDALPRRARISGQLAQDDPEKIVRQVDFSRFNARFEIQPPD